MIKYKLKRSISLLLFGFLDLLTSHGAGVLLCSEYTFHDNIGDWKESMRRCDELENGSLASMETEREWHFIKNLTAKKEKQRWFIGLESVNGSHTWCWLNKRIACVNETLPGTWRWSDGEPNHHYKELCAEMWHNGKYNNIECQKKDAYHDNPGYICEKQVNCSTVSQREDIFMKGTTGPASNRQLLTTTTTATSFSTKMTSAKTKDWYEMLLKGSTHELQTTRATKRSTQPSVATTSVLQNRSTFNQPTKGTASENTVRKSSWKNFSLGKINLVMIVIVLLAVFILAIAVAFAILFCRRLQGHKNQDHLHDRVTCTYEVPPSSELQSNDPVHVQQTQSSTELTVHLTLSQTESGLATYETRSDCKKESEHDDMDEASVKSRSGSEGCSEIQEQERKKAMMASGRKGREQPPTLCDEKEENKDNVYAIVHKERKGKVNSEASALKISPGRPQEGTSGLPTSGVDFTGRSSHQTDSGLDNIAKAAESETPRAGGNNEYLYAAVDITTKKKKPPQMPPPYRGLVYADLAHTRENSAKLAQEQSQTVYAQIDHVKTASVKISQQNLEETKEGEHE